MARLTSEGITARHDSISRAERADALAALRSVCCSWCLGRLAAPLLPAARAGEAGSASLLVLEMIGLVLTECENALAFDSCVGRAEHAA